MNFVVWLEYHTFWFHQELPILFSYPNTGQQCRFGKLSQVLGSRKIARLPLDTCTRPDIMVMYCTHDLAGLDRYKFSHPITGVIDSFARKDFILFLIIQSKRFHVLCKCCFRFRFKLWTIWLVFGSLCYQTRKYHTSSIVNMQCRLNRLTIF